MNQVLVTAALNALVTQLKQMKPGETHNISLNTPFEISGTLSVFSDDARVKVIAQTTAWVTLIQVKRIQ